MCGKLGMSSWCHQAAFGQKLVGIEPAPGQTLLLALFQSLSKENLYVCHQEPVKMGFYISLNVQLLKEEIIFVLVDFCSS